MISLRIYCGGILLEDSWYRHWRGKAARELGYYLSSGVGLTYLELVPW